MIYFIIYIFAISFQVSGTLQLLISFVSTKRDDIIRRFIGKGLLFRDNNTKKIEYDKSAYKYEYKTAYLNKCSFIYIFIGYLIVCAQTLFVVYLLNIYVIYIFHDRNL